MRKENGRKEDGIKRPFSFLPSSFLPFALGKIRDQSGRIAKAKGHWISRLSVMPDHLHLSLRGNLNDSSETIALGFQNNLAFCLGQVQRASYYAGTFSEYDMNAVRTWDW